MKVTINGTVHTGVKSLTVEEEAAVQTPTPPPPPVEKPPVVNPPPVQTAKQIIRQVDPEATNLLRAKGLPILDIQLGADQEIALEIDRKRFDEGGVFRVFQASSDLAISISATPWDFGPPGVRTPLYDNVGGGMAPTVKELGARLGQLPPSPNGKLYFNVRWSVYTSWGANAPLRNFLKESGAASGKFEFRKDT